MMEQAMEHRRCHDGIAAKGRAQLVLPTLCAVGQSVSMCFSSLPRVYAARHGSEFSVTTKCRKGWSVQCCTTSQFVTY